MTFETPEIELHKSAEEVYAFFSDFNNFKKLLPSSIEDWQSDADHCSFTLKGMGKMALKFEEKTPFTFLKIIPEGKTPFEYFMTCNITPQEIGCKVKITFDASLNPFMKMMAEKPLSKFVEIIEGKIREIFG
jgi:hypothetical protein